MPMALLQPRGVIEIDEPLAKYLSDRDIPDPEQLLLQRPDDLLRETPCRIGSRASQRLALEEAWVLISSPEQWSTVMTT